LIIVLARRKQGNVLLALVLVVLKSSALHPQYVRLLHLAHDLYVLHRQ
jgi:hypothetical protein